MHAELLMQLERARGMGFLGPGPVVDHVVHAAGFVAALADATGRVVDLGSGAGVPGLVLAVERPDLEILLLEATHKRCAFLEEAIGLLRLAGVRVIQGRAEELGRGELRGSADAVVARSFGAPAVTAECAAPLLRVAGQLIVSEPPVAPSPDAPRWPPAGVALLGLRVGTRSTTSPAVQVLTQVDVCPDRFPRRVGMPAKHPLF